MVKSKTKIWERNIFLQGHKYYRTVIVGFLSVKFI